MLGEMVLIDFLLAQMETGWKQERDEYVTLDFALNIQNAQRDSSIFSPNGNRFD